MTQLNAGRRPTTGFMPQDFPRSLLQRHPRLGLAVGGENLEVMHARSERMIARPDDFVFARHFHH